MSHVYFTNSGSEANDTIVKLVRYYNNAIGRPKKKKFIARRFGFHGLTLASASLSQMVGLLTLGGSVRYTGARPDLSGKPELPSYVLLDLTARYALTRDWTLFGRIENATDSRYQTAYGYNQLPRTTTVGLSWKLKS